MAMTDEQKYSAVLKELGELLQNKNMTISCQQWQIDNLKEKLAAAEKERDEMCEAMGDNENALGDGETYYLLDREAIAALREINAELRKIFTSTTCTTCGNSSERLAELQNTIAKYLPFTKGAA